MRPTILAFTPGEPAGIGPDLAVQLAQTDYPDCIVALADPELLIARSSILKLPLKIKRFAGTAHQAGSLQVIPVQLKHPAQAGKLDLLNADYVLQSITDAVSGCLNENFDAMVTGPIQKSIINEAGIVFSGHTEFLAQHCGNFDPVMMLANERLKVALVTTHLPLARVAEKITQQTVKRVIVIVNQQMKQRFNCMAPRLAICGLNPHAGEGGYLGREEIEIINPVIERLNQQGLNLSQALPADTAFTPGALKECDAVIAMYHDQGLPVIKSMGFGETVNVTLGLPIIRTSVDHGTALTLAGTGKAKIGSLMAALNMASTMVKNSKNHV